MHRAAPTVVLFALSCAGDGGGNGKCADPETLYADEDGDGHGAAEDRYEGCDPPSGYVPSDDDCDDGDEERSPDAAERCNAIDDDCDDLIDDEDPSVLGEDVAYADRDSDGFGAGPGLLFCEAPGGFVGNADDCDDEAAGTHPLALEVCGNDDDEDCDTVAAECRLAGALSLKAPDLAIVAGKHSAYEQFGAAMTTPPSRKALAVSAPGDPWSDGVFLFEGLGAGSYDENDASATLKRDDPQRVLGTSLAAGDVDGDDQDDLVIAAPLAWLPFAPSTDEVYVELGPLTTHVITGPAILSGDPGFAHVVSCTGDFDGDGVGDVAIGSPTLDTYGSVTMFLGGSWTGPLDRGDADVTMTASSDTGNGLGTSIGHADLDGDGRADLVIGAPTGSGGGPGSGVAYLRLGTASPDAALSFPSDADGGFLGTSLYDGFGTAVGAGDLDGDGVAQDVWVGAPGRREAYAFFAPSGTTKASGADVTLAQENDGSFGAVGDLGGDVDGDGHPDLVIGDPLRDSYSGAAYVYFTPPSATPAASLLGSAWYTWAGNSVAVSDLTRDGYGDVFVGTPFCSSGGAHGCVAGFVGGP